MSIVKDVNMNGASFNDCRDLYKYLIDALKTDNCKYVYGLGFVTPNYLGEFQSVKITNQKTSGRQFRQITISPSPVGNALSNAKYIQIGRKIGKFYYNKGYQVIIVLHLDTDVRHLHLMVNSVNFRNGKMFSQSKSDLNRLKLHCNHIFADYGLDQIRQSDDAMLESIAHDMSEGFDCLEIYDDIMADKASALADLYDDPSESISLVRSSKRQRYRYPTSPYNYRANNFTRIPHLPKMYNNIHEVNNMINSINNPALPIISANQLPSPISTTQGLYVTFGKEVNMALPKDWSPQQVSEFINNIDPLPEKEKAFDARIGDALFSDLRTRGIEAPVCVSSTVKLNLSFDDVMESDVIDVPYSEE